MKRNTIKKTIATLALAGLAVLAAAATGVFEGFLRPGQSDGWYGTYTEGWVTVRIDGHGLGDLDLYAYDEDGCLLDKDTLDDNDPMVRFYNPFRQRIDLVVVNEGDYSASYEGEVN